MVTAAILVILVAACIGIPCLALGWAFAKTLEWMDTNPNDKDAHK